MRHSHYFRIIGGVRVDHYYLMRVFDVTDPALQHASKKVMFAGARGAKDRRRDVQEAIDTLRRWLEIEDALADGGGQYPPTAKEWELAAINVEDVPAERDDQVLAQAYFIIEQNRKILDEDKAISAAFEGMNFDVDLPPEGKEEVANDTQG